MKLDGKLVSLRVKNMDVRLVSPRAKSMDMRLVSPRAKKHGIERGTFLNSIETAKRMLRLQEFSLEKIAAISGLSLDEVKKLQ